MREGMGEGKVRKKESKKKWEGRERGGRESERSGRERERKNGKKE